MAYNEKSLNNLKPLNERPIEERKQIASKGGKTTIAKKKQLKDFKELANILLTADIEEKEDY